MNRVPADRIAYAFVLTAAGLWVAAIVAPALVASRSPGLADSLYNFFSPICHQMDERSLHIESHKLAVCIRCSAVYGSFFLTLIGLPVVRTLSRLPAPSAKLALIALAPMCLDVALSAVGLHQSSSLTRTLTGTVAGTGLALLLLPLLLEGLPRILLPSSPYGDHRAAKTQ